MIYGAYGFSGALVAEEAVRRGHHPVLAGRSAAPLRDLSERLGLEHEVFDLEGEERVAEAVQGLDLVLHCAGPFVRTWEPVFGACLRAGAHYVDISAEATVLESMFSRGNEAEDAGIALLPGAGFAVVATDCAARIVAERVPDLSDLEIGVLTTGGLSRGTLRTALAHIPSGVLVRRGGALVPQTVGRGMRPIRFPDRTRTGLPIPWGDLATAHPSTGSANITAYVGLPRGLDALARWVGPLGWRVLSPLWVRRLLEAVVGLAATGPDARAREKGRSYVWVRAQNPAGEEAQVWLKTAEAYRFTALSAVRCVERILDGTFSGALTPAGAFGHGFVLDIPGTERLDSLEKA